VSAAESDICIQQFLICGKSICVRRACNWNLFHFRNAVKENTTLQTVLAEPLKENDSL
jgi:hypothetical protein